MTAEEFEGLYAWRSRMTVAELRAVGRVVRPCGCGSLVCEGWQSLSHDAAAEWDYAAVGRPDVLVSRGEALMPFTSDQIAEIFTYHAPTPEQLVQYEAIRVKARELAETIVQYTPPSADQTTAIRKLRECVHVANGAIALQGRF